MNSRVGLCVAAIAYAIAAPALAQQVDPHDWAVAAAKGAFDLCRADAPDAAAVAEHGQVWGWPTFVPYLEHLKGYRREAGGESRRVATFGETTINVELGVQSGQVTSAAPANIRYFRCDVSVDQPVNEDLDAYFSAAYGPPASQTDQGTVWIVPKGVTAVDADAAASDEAALKPVVSGGAGAGVTRIELTRERGLDRAKLTILQQSPAQ